MRDHWLPILAALALLGGFADLALGGTTVAAILLVAGYCLAVPATILRGRLPGRQHARGPRLSR